MASRPFQLFMGNIKHPESMEKSPSPSTQDSNTPDT